MYELPAAHPLVTGRTTHAPLVRALRGDRPDHTPIWFMRQAGRSLPEYRALRAEHAMLDACLTPEIASEITLQPVRRHGVDAAVFFSDIVVPLKLAGVPVELVAGRGPVFAEPVRSLADAKRLRDTCSPERLREAIDPIAEAVALTVQQLGEVPLIGFAGAPFTLAAYLVEGGPSKDHLRARSLMHAEPETWQILMRWIAELSGVFLEAQLHAGASAVQLFDSWAGSLSPADYRQHVAPYSAQTLAHIAQLRAGGEAVPTIHFAVGGSHLLHEFRSLNTSALGIDWRVPLDEASAALGDDIPLQGNIDPAYLAAPPAVLEAHVDEVLQRGLRAPAHVVNLGHGVSPDCDPDTLTRMVEHVHVR